MKSTICLTLQKVIFMIKEMTEQSKKEDCVMRCKKLLAGLLSVGVLVSSLAGTLTGAALEAGGSVTFEAEATLEYTYNNMVPGTPLNKDFGQSFGKANELCANANGIPQIVDSNSTSTTFTPLYFVMEIEIPKAGFYTMTASYRGHQTGRMVSFYAGEESGYDESNPTVLDVSGDTKIGQVDMSYFAGANSDYIETINVSETGASSAEANQVYLEAGLCYIKAVITGVGAGTSNPNTRLNLDKFTLTLVAEAGATADYTAVDNAIAQIPEDLSAYTDESASNVTAAREAVVRDLPVSEQARVDKMAADILEAVKYLVRKDAVPTAVDFLASQWTDPANSSAAFVTQSFSGAPDFSRFEGQNVGDYATYNINVPAGGEYVLSLDYRAHESVGKAYFYLNGEKQKKNFDSPGSPNTRGQVSMGLVHLKAGKNTLRFEMYEEGSKGSAKLNLFYIKINPYEDPAEDVQVEGEPFTLHAFRYTDPENSTPDVFEIEYEDIPISLANTTEAGQYVQYTFNNRYAGRYKVQVQYRAGTSVGKAKAFVNGEEVAKVFDCSGMVENVYYDSLGFWDLPEGENTLRFEITGKDASRSGYNLELYTFVLTPAGYQADSGLAGFTQVSPAVSTDKVEVYPQYSVNTASSRYSVTVDGVNLPITQYGNEYDYGEFTMKEGPVTVRVNFHESINSYSISPKSLGLTGTVSGSTLTFTLEKDEYLIISINGDNRRLVLTADPPVADVPDKEAENVLDVTAEPYNADNTGKYIVTDVIQQAIDDASAIGTESEPGVVYVPAGVYQTGSLMLRSNVRLYLEGGAILWGSTRHMDWMPKGRKTSIGRAVTYLVYTDDNTVNTSVDGRGTVDGNALTFKQDSSWKYAVECLAPVNTSYFSTDGIVYRGSGVWCVVPAFSNHLTFENFKVYNNVGYGEDDGIDVNGCQDVVVRNSISINWDDPYSTKTERDGFEINAGWGSAEGKVTVNDNILFDDCIAWTGCYGFKVGQGIGYNQSNITVQNSTVYDCAVGFGIHHKRFNGFISNVTFDNITVENITRQNEDHKMWFQCFLQDDNKQAVDGDMISNVVVKNINVLARSTSSPKMVSRRDGSNISGVTFENIRMYGSTAPASSLGQLGFTTDSNNPLLSSSADKSRGHIYNASNYGITGAVSSKIPGVYYNNSGAAFTTENEETAYGGMVVRLTGGNAAFYNMVDFGTGVDSMAVRYASDVADAKVEFHLDSADGPLIGTLDAGGSDEFAYQTKTVRLTGAEGIHDLYVVASDSVKLDYMDTGRLHYPVIGEQDTVKDVLFADGANTVDLTAVVSEAGVVELRDGSADGEVLGTTEFTETGRVTVTARLSGRIAGLQDVCLVAADGVDVEDISLAPDGLAEMPYVSAVTSPDSLQAEVGTAAEDLGLPETVEVTLSDGTTVQAAVTWDFSGYNGDAAGVYTLEGSLAPSADYTNDAGCKASVQVTVADETLPYITGVTTPDAITAAYGTAVEDLDLPETVEVTLSDGTTAQAVVTWNTDNYNGNAAGSYTLEGTLAAGEGFTNADNVTVSMQVTVSEVSKGDVNGDGKIDITDVMGLCRILARQNIGEEPNDQELLRGDMNGDGFIRIEDVMSVCRVIARQK